ncbi:SDR family oxidoreductase [Pseudarthrobacter sp. P1]|uniref:SDR family oxidoreductase n=1 Tax=Pseudarthrobacter sp. P1 TaxID=3418418 RepID=UPI003CE8D872
MKILVTGATGTVGASVAKQLLGRGHHIAALVRNPEAATLPEGIEVIKGDLTNHDDVRRALAGFDRAFINMAKDNGAVFAEAAAAAGLEHVVLLSSFTVSTPIPLGGSNVITARHRAGEKTPVEAGLPSTFLRCSGFNYNFLMWTSESARGVVRAPYLDAKLPVVHTEDIASSAVAVLLTEQPRGGAFSITGPQALSVRDQATIAGDVLGREFRVERINIDTANATAFAEGTPAIVRESALGAMGAEATALAVSGDVLALTGHPARTFTDWVATHQHAIA